MVHLNVGRLEHTHEFMHTWNCLALNPTRGPSWSLLPTQTASDPHRVSGKGFSRHLESDLFPGCWVLNLESSACKTEVIPLRYISSKSFCSEESKKWRERFIFPSILNNPVNNCLPHLPLLYFKPMFLSMLYFSGGQFGTGMNSWEDLFFF